MADALLETKAREVLDAREAYDIAYKDKVKAEIVKKRLEAELNEDMKKAKLEGGTLALGEGYGTWQFNREQKVNSSVFDEEAAIKYFEENGMSAGYVEGKVRKKPTNQLVRESLESGQELPPGIEPRITKYVKATKRK